MPIDPQRDARNREVLASHNLDAVICRLPENILLLAGYWPVSSAACVLFPREGGSTLIAVESAIEIVPDGAADRVVTYRAGVLDAPDPFESLESLLRDTISASGLTRARIGLELGFETVAAGHTGGDVVTPAVHTRDMIRAAAPHAAFVDATPSLEQSRRRKTPREIECLRLANEIAAFGLEAFRETFEPGRTEAEVAAAVEAAIMARGIGHRDARHVRSWAQLMSGPGSSQAFSTHPATSAHTIERGDLGVLELATVVNGFWSDLTRTLVAGGAPDGRQSEMYGVVLEAVDGALKTAHAGMTGAEVDALARDIVSHRDYGDLFVHPTGHGLGFRYHESAPILRPGSKDPVEEGAVTSIEPGLYLDGFGGMRIEQNVAFRDDEVELLSFAPTGLTP